MKDRVFFEASDCDLDAFRALTARRLDPSEVPHAAEVAKNVPDLRHRRAVRHPC